MAQFFIRNKNAVGNDVLTIRIRKRIPKIDMWVSSGIEVNVDDWNRANTSISKMKAYEKTAEGKKVKELTTLVNDAIETLLSTGDVPDIDDVKKVVSDIVNHEANEIHREEEERRKAIEAEKRKEQEEEERKRKANVLLYLHERIEGMQDGSIKKNKGGRSYESSTIQVWQSFEKLLIPFYNQHPFTWETIDIKLVHAFINYCEKGKASSNTNSRKKSKKTFSLMDNTINKYLAVFRSLIGFSYKDGLHNHVEAKEYFRDNKRVVTRSEKQAEIYLTSDELQSLFEMPLVGEKAKYRDLFLVGTYLCQRVSDYTKIKKENFRETAKGTKVVQLKQEKTGTEIVIPILDDNLLTIMERNKWDLTIKSKYKNHAPLCFDAVSTNINKIIKDILKELSETVPSLARLEATRLTMKDRQVYERGEVSYELDAVGNFLRPRYELVTSHTARRSGITNLYKSGKFDIFQMMAISGHKDQRTFCEYIKLSADEIADGIAERAKETKQVVNLF